MTSATRTELTTVLNICRQNVKDPYALSYLSTDAFETAEELYGESALSTQLFYALNNMNSWKGPLARETKARIKKLIVVLE